MLTPKPAQRTALSEKKTLKATVSPRCTASVSSDNCGPIGVGVAVGVRTGVGVNSGGAVGVDSGIGEEAEGAGVISAAGVTDGDSRVVSTDGGKVGVFSGDGAATGVAFESGDGDGEGVTAEIAVRLGTAVRPSLVPVADAGVAVAVTVGTNCGVINRVGVGVKAEGVAGETVGVSAGVASPSIFIMTNGGCPSFSDSANTTRASSSSRKRAKVSNAWPRARRISNVPDWSSPTGTPS